MNYGETLTYWYLRLNGFFPLTNFVLHKSDGIKYTSDCDILAVRPPLVYEEVGGKPDDWDSWLLDHIETGKTLGVICEVKTGNYEAPKIFRPEYVKYAAKRLGMTDQDEDIKTIAEGEGITDIGETYRIIKLFVSKKTTKGKFVNRSLEQMIQFLLDRIEKYEDPKYRDRMFFGSILFQGLVEIRKIREVTKA